MLRRMRSIHTSIGNAASRSKPKSSAHAATFGFERLAAFPIDVWIERILRSIYFAKKRRVTTKHLREFSARHFGPFGGYAQQYLFHHARTTMPRGSKSK